MAKIGRGDGDGDGDGKKDEPSSPVRFADLVRDAKPLDKGPRRTERPGPRRPISTTSAANPRGVGAGPFRWPDLENRFSACAEGVSDAQLRALGRGDPEPEERIDLHGTRRDAAARLLAKRLESARSQSLSCVLVIHGQGQRSASGEAVLREALPGWLSAGRSAHHVLAFTPAPDRLGGLGATLVLLRRKSLKSSKP